MLMIDFWPYDLIVSGSLDFSSEITDHPIEDGSEVTDNATRKPVGFTLETIVSDTPIGEIAQHDSRRIDEVSEAVFGSDQVPLPSSEAYDRLTAIWAESRPVVIEIPFASRSNKPGKRVFKNMMIEKLSLPLGPDSDGGLHFSVEFKQVTLVQNKRVVVRTAVPRGQPRRDKKATVGGAVRVDQEVMWRMAYPPGSTPLDNCPFAIVDVTWSDGKGGPGAKAVYTWDAQSSFGASGKLPISPAYGYLPGKVLNSVALDAFVKDMQRAIDDKKKAWKKVNGMDGPGAVYNPRPADTGNYGMPAGYTPGRFSPASNAVPELGPLAETPPDVAIERKGF